MKRKPYKYRLRYWLYKHNKSQLELANHLNISFGTVGRWMYLKIDSHFDIPFTKVLAIAEFFKCKPQEVYTDFERTLKEDLKRVNYEEL